MLAWLLRLALLATPNDNALAETVNGLYKTELIYARPAWPSAPEVEFQTMNWVHWWNTARLHEALDYQTPAEVEAEYHMTRAQALSPIEQAEQNPVRFTEEADSSMIVNRRAWLLLRR